MRSYQYKFLKKKPLKFECTFIVFLVCSLWSHIFSGHIPLGALFISCALTFYLDNWVVGA